MNIMFVILVNLLLASHFYAYEEKLIHTHIIHTQGLASPRKLLSTGLYKIKTWAGGLGKLTDIGIRQQVQLGKWLRKNYKNLLSKNFRYSEISVKSIDEDKSLMSAESNLIGLVYDDKNTIIEGLQWKPIPVRSVPTKDDLVMLPQNCKKYNTEKLDMYKNELYQSTLLQFQPTLNKLRNVLDNPTLQFPDIHEVFDVLYSEKSHNIPWDSWVTETIYKNLTLLNSLDWKIMYNGEKLQKLAGGLFLNEIITHLKTIALTPGLDEAEKMKLYFGNDKSLASLMSAIGIYRNIRPSPSSCLIIELWEISKDNRKSLENFVVKMYYQTETFQKNVLPEIIFEKCSSHPCLLSDFIDAVSSKILVESEYVNLCFPKEYGSYIKITVILFTGAVILALLYYKFYRKRSSYTEI